MAQTFPKDEKSYWFNTMIVYKCCITSVQFKCFDLCNFNAAAAVNVFTLVWEMNKRESCDKLLCWDGHAHTTLRIYLCEPVGRKHFLPGTVTAVKTKQTLSVHQAIRMKCCQKSLAALCSYSNIWHP